MYLVPAVVDVQDERAHHLDVAADRRQYERVVVALTRSHGVGLGDRVRADRFQNQITGLLVHIVGVEAGLASAGLTGVEAQPNVVVTVRFSAFKVDGAGDRYANARSCSRSGLYTCACGSGVQMALGALGDDVVAVALGVVKSEPHAVITRQPNVRMLSEARR
jgi:hypothetical protein